MRLPQRVVRVHESLDRRRIPHAFGGAIALAYWTSDPRGTSDIDVNIFVATDDAAGALRALPRGVEVPAGTDETISREGQVRLWWDDTPLDLFFNYEPIHEEAARNRRSVPFEGTRIPILGPVELAVFKVMFDRTRDWADIEAMVAAGTLDAAAVKDRLLTLIDADDPRVGRLQEAVRRGYAQARVG